MNAHFHPLGHPQPQMCASQTEFSAMFSCLEQW